MKGFLLSLFFFASVAQAQNTDFTIGTADLVDLTTVSGATSWALNDDSVSGAISLGFSFDFYGETFTSGKGATNGCFTFNTSYNYVCSDYTPDPLPKANFDLTIFPFWTDLIRDNGSKMLYNTFGATADTDQYFVLGWYNLREYNRASDNTFELLLYETTNKIEFRYGDLDIKNHDVVIGLQGHALTTTHSMYDANEYVAYIYHDECNTGSTNGVSCVNTNWNNTAYNTTIENKSLSGIFEDQHGCASNALLASTCSGYAVAYFNQQCGVSALYNSECTGYAAAYLDQQCNINSLYSSECSGYAVAYFNQQCGLDTLYNNDCTGYDDAYYDRECSQNSQYDTGCAGYIFETVYYYDDSSTGYYEDDYSYVNEFDYGYEDEYLIDDDPYADMYFTDAEWYDIDIQEFGQEQVDEWYGSDVSFNNEGTIVWEDSVLESWDELDTEMDVYDQLVESYEEIYEEPYVETYTDFDVVFAHEEYADIVEYISVVNAVEVIDVIFDAEELRDEYELETIHSEAFEEEWEEIIEEEIIDEEAVEEMEEEFIEEEHEEELLADEEIDEEIEEELDVDEKTTAEKRAKRKISKGKQSMLDAMAKATETQNTAVGSSTSTDVASIDNVDSVDETTGAQNASVGNFVANTMTGASISSAGINQSIGSTSTSTTQSGGNSSVSGGASTPTLSAMSNSVSGGSMSTSNSPSISDQIASSAVQTNTILSLSGDTGAISNVSVMVTPMPTLSESPTVAMAEVQVQNMQGDIDTAMSGVMTASEADQVADQIVAQNIKEQQEEIKQQQSSTGEYADSSTLIAYMGYVPGFNAYTQQTVPQAAVWYEPKSIYATVSIPDNNSAFVNMYSNSLNGMRDMINLQPNL